MDKCCKVLEKMNLLRKQVPACVMLIAVVLAGLTGAVIAFSESTITSRSVTTIGGEVFTLTGDLGITSYSASPSSSIYSVAPITLDPAGTSTLPVVMSATTGITANTAITQGDFVYTVTVAVVHDASTATTYDVTLKVDGTVNGDVYIQQLSGTSTSQIGNSVSISWDLGNTLLSHVFEVDIVPT